MADSMDREQLEAKFRAELEEAEHLVRVATLE